MPARTGNAVPSGVAQGDGRLPAAGKDPGRGGAVPGPAVPAGAAGGRVPVRLYRDSGRRVRGIRRNRLVLADRALHLVLPPKNLGIPGRGRLP
jgi:hypothetical protein